PREGEFEFAWMDRVIDRLHQAGIKVLLGTPTYSIPPWLYRKHPEIHRRTRINDDPAPYGMRQQADLSHPTYRWYCERVIRQIVNHYRNHPAVIGYQIDNETGNGFAARENYLSFIDELKKRYKSVDVINRIWGFNYWGQSINDWDELAPVDGMVNPGYKLEWERFQQKITTDFLAWQAQIVRELKRPDQFITHNFVGGFRTNINQYEIARCLDIAAVNPYTPVQDDLTGEEICFSGDLNRSFKRQNYLVTETNAQTIGWDSKYQRPPYDGQLRLNAYFHFASGANSVAYWHWHSLHYGQETYWKGVLSHDLQPNRIYREASRIAQELKKIGPEIVDLKKKNRVALLADVDSYHGIRFMPFDDRVDYLRVLHQLYHAAYALNVELDFVFPQTASFADYDVLLVPALYVASDDLLKRIADFVKNGGRALITFKSGFCNEYSTVRWELAPGPLRPVIGAYYQEFSNLAAPLALKGDPFQAGEGNRVSVWAEFLIPETAKPLAFYDHPFFGQWPAIVENQYGKGKTIYEGTFLSDELQIRVMKKLFADAGILGEEQKLPAKVKVRSGVNRKGRTIRYCLNISGEPQAFVYPFADGRDLLSGRAVKQGESVTLAPWDLLIVESTK
ncbi:MAG: beta-galactosidase, partial [candidate division KSB1 bacterium]|nr:beta-galactosidase [candidate division KSB1 bacterium]